jgi:hypothetical protein
VRREHFMLLFIVSIALASICKAQKPHDVSGLLAELNQPKTTDRAAEAISRVCSKDPNSCHYVVEKLPAMIDRPEGDEIWLNAVRLAGRLKASEALPSLQKAFFRGQLVRKAR